MTEKPRCDDDDDDDMCVCFCGRIVCAGVNYEVTVAEVGVEVFCDVRCVIAIGMLTIGNTMVCMTLLLRLEHRGDPLHPMGLCFFCRVCTDPPTAPCGKTSGTPNPQGVADDEWLDLRASDGTKQEGAGKKGDAEPIAPVAKPRDEAEGTQDKVGGGQNKKQPGTRCGAVVLYHNSICSVLGYRASLHPQP